MPVAFTPSAMQKLVGGDGEVTVARTAARMQISMTLSLQTTTSLDTMAAAKAEARRRPSLWIQIYLTPDMNHNMRLITRAEGNFV